MPGLLARYVLGILLLILAQALLTGVMLHVVANHVPPIGCAATHDTKLTEPTPIQLADTWLKEQLASLANFAIDAVPH